LRELKQTPAAATAAVAAAAAVQQWKPPSALFRKTIQKKSVYVCEDQTDLGNSFGQIKSSEN